MARGRIITNAITRDKAIHDMSNDTSRLAFTWLVTFADREGRTHGDPALVRSMLFPRRDDVTTEHVKSFIQEWVDLGLVEHYEASGDWWISFLRFDKNQPGLRKEREPESNIPPPPGAQSTPAAPTDPPGFGMPDECRNDDGPMPDECREIDGIREEKRREGNRSELPQKTRETDIPQPDTSTVPHDQTTAAYQEIRQTWIALFPEKRQPRAVNKTLQGKVRTRWRSDHFRENWQGALERASQSSFLQTAPWFDLGWFLRNDDHYDRCLAGNYDDKPGRLPPGHNGRPIDRQHKGGVF